MSRNILLKPRDQRDIKRLISIIKSLALLNLWWREKSGTTITANEDDIEQAFEIWGRISMSQELSLPPYIYNLYQEVILVAWKDKNANRSEGFIEATGLLGLSREEIQHKHNKVYGRMLDAYKLSKEILPTLEASGLIIQENDPNDKRRMLTYPIMSSDTSQINTDEGAGVEIIKEENNSETQGGVDIIN